MTQTVLIGPSLGEGGFAVVRQALDPERRRHYAFKELLEDKRREPYITALHAEAWIMQQISHPSVPRVYGYVEERAAYLMDLLVAVSLDEVVSTVAAAPLAVRMRMAVDVIEAIATMHRRGFLHLDIKLANMMITPYGTVYLIDFGVAAMHWMRMALGRPIDVPVTAQYAPPEAFDNKVDPTPAADVYSLGVSLYRIFTGKRPYNVPGIRPFEAQQAILEAHERGILHPSDVDGSISRTLGDVILGAMAPSAEKRPRDAGQLLSLLLRSASSVSPADQGQVESWAVENLRGDMSARLPEQWKGEEAEAEIRLEAGALIPEPKIPTISIDPIVDSGTVKQGGRIVIVWGADPVVKKFEVRLKTPEDLRARTRFVHEPRMTLNLKSPGEYSVNVRAMSGDLRGPWAEALKLNVSSGRKWVLMAASGLLFLALVVGLGLVWDLTRGEGPVPPTPTATSVFEQNDKPTPEPTETPTATYGPPTATPIPIPPTPTPEPIAAPVLQTPIPLWDAPTPVPPTRTAAPSWNLSPGQPPTPTSAPTAKPVPWTPIPVSTTPTPLSPSPTVRFDPSIFELRLTGTATIMVAPTNLDVISVNGIATSPPGFRVSIPARVLDKENTLNVRQKTGPNEEEGPLRTINFQISLSRLKRTGTLNLRSEGPLKRIRIILKKEDGGAR